MYTTFGLWGWWPYCPKKNTQCPKACAIQTHSNRKSFTILTSNDIIIPKLQLNPNFSNLQWKRKLDRRIGYFEKSGVTKITVFDWGEENDFYFELLGGSKKSGFEKLGSNCSCLKPRILYDIDRLPNKIKSL